MLMLILANKLMLMLMLANKLMLMLMLANKLIVDKMNESSLLRVYIINFRRLSHDQFNSA